MTQPLPEQPPGHPSWLRILTETNAAQREPLADGAERIGALDPESWFGAARDGFTAQRLQLSSQFHVVLEVHGTTSNEISGYNRFLHELQHLWAGDLDNPVELQRWNELYNSTSSKLSKTLEAGAARLDELVRDPAPVEVPAATDRRPESEPRESEPLEPERQSPEPPDADATRTNAVEEARFEPRADPATMFRERNRDHELLTELMQAGRRVERILWRRPLV